MGYGSTGRFLEEAAFMEAASLGRGSSIVSLGDQTVPLNSDAEIDLIKRFVDRFGGDFDRESYSKYVGGPMHVRRVYEDCGMDYVSVDLNCTDGSVPIDLNDLPFKHSLGGSFDMLTNYGTTEHVGNQLNAFAWCHYLVKSGGLMFIVLPMLNFFNHAMCLITPYFYKKLIDANCYEILESKLISSPAHQGMAFHYGSELCFFDGLSELIEKTPFHSQMCLVLKKTSDAAFVPPLDIDLPQDEMWPIVEQYLRKRGDVYTEDQRQLAVTNFCSRGQSSSEKYLSKIEGDVASLDHAQLSRAAEAVKFLYDTRP